MFECKTDPGAVAGPAIREALKLHADNCEGKSYPNVCTPVTDYHFPKMPEVDMDAIASTVLEGAFQKQKDALTAATNI